MPETTGGRRRLPRKRGEWAAQQIAWHITSNGLRDGETLAPAAKLADEVGVSRGTLHEAFRMLELVGLLDVRPGNSGGPRVRTPDSQSLADILAVFLQSHGATYRDVIAARLVIEPVAAGLAALNADASVLEQLERIVNATAGAPTDDEPDYLDVTVEFHQLIISAAGNPVISLMASCLEWLQSARVSGLIFPPDARERVSIAHQRIAEAVLQKSPETAQQRMREHMEELASYAADRFPGLLDEPVRWQ